MLRCKEVTELIATDGIKSLGWTKRMALRMHLFMCKYCRLYMRQLRDISNTLRSIFSEPYSKEETEVLDKLEEKVMSSLPGKHPGGSSPGSAGNNPSN